KCRIYDLDAKIKAQEAALPPNQRVNSPELVKLREELNQARAEYAASEARLEALKARHAGAIALANLLAAYVQAGKDTQALEAAIEAALSGKDAQEQKLAAQPTQQAQPNGQPTQAQNAQVNGQKADSTATGTFKVLECRESKPGVVRAYCEGPDGKVAVFAKNGNAQALAGAIGKKVEVKYRQGEKGLIALNVRLAG
ncbi:MAG: hypothetical protein H5T99_04480, partial [Moorella sp. (in: Bacteria)]|nr:hypothetical protein [Moorella sp. (in: firmicutes)]